VLASPARRYDSNTSEESAFLRITAFWNPSCASSVGGRMLLNSTRPAVVPIHGPSRPSRSGVTSRNSGGSRNRIREWCANRPIASPDSTSASEPTYGARDRSASPSAGGLVRK
jgi:hypothetical protein